jgi:hypothetical protein
MFLGLLKNLLTDSLVPLLLPLYTPFAFAIAIPSNCRSLKRLLFISAIALKNLSVCSQMNLNFSGQKTTEIYTHVAVNTFKTIKIR